MKTQRYWFVAKKYGWGWRPSTWQGWIALFVFMSLIIGNFFRIDASSPSVNHTLMCFIPETFICIVLFMGLCFVKGEPPSWHWGD